MVVRESKLLLTDQDILLSRRAIEFRKDIIRDWRLVLKRIRQLVKFSRDKIACDEKLAELIT
jgi:hypothetical protein